LFQIKLKSELVFFSDGDVGTFRNAVAGAQKTRIRLVFRNFSINAKFLLKRANAA
jgi:hypothetical protein